VYINPVSFRTVANYPAPSSPTGTVQLLLEVPSAAKVFVNGYSTDSGGQQRRYFASDLHVGYDYDFRIVVETWRDNKRYAAVKTVRAQAGQTYQLTFTLPDQRDDGQPRDRVASNVRLPAEREF
jgi:uncharacterized protein (TIGR03000 family)